MPKRDPTPWTVGAVEIIRVPDPGFELVLPQDPDTAALLKATPWLSPSYVDDDQALVIGSSTIALRTPSATVLVDPFLAFDDPARLGPRLSALRAAGIEADDVDVVVSSHVDGFGVTVLADGTPTFPRARYLLPSAEVRALASAPAEDAASQAFRGLAEVGLLESVDPPLQVVPGVHVEDAPGHSTGHVVVWVRSGGSQAVVTGHLFLHPAQIANPEIDNGDLDPGTLVRTRRALLERSEREGALLIGPLFAAPGGGRVRRDGDGWYLEPVEPG